MRGKVCLITGANSGIGKGTAFGLAKMGATVVMVARNLEKGQAALEEIKEASGNDSVDLMMADLSSQAAVRELAASFEEQYENLDVLINNAAIIPPKRTITVDGIEIQFAVNHLAPFLLTNLLIDTLKASAPSRIITVSSTAHRDGKIDFDDLQSAKKYIRLGWEQYSNTKLANILFTTVLSQKLEGTGVTANSLHPGVIWTNLWRGFPSFLYPLAKLIFKPVAEGTQTPLYLATSPEVEGVTGKYFKDRKPIEAAPQAYDQSTAQRLWQVSAELTSLLAI
jgi:NAD(P)-dependent dehydrogenase (short-subunit alcohol dehydrogenase family)